MVLVVLDAVSLYPVFSVGVIDVSLISYLLSSSGFVVSIVASPSRASQTDSFAHSPSR